LQITGDKKDDLLLKDKFTGFETKFHQDLCFHQFEGLFTQAIFYSC